MRRKISLKHKETKQGARSVVHRFRRSTIFRKFLIAYVLFAVFGFIATGTLVESMTGNYVKRNQAARLYAAAMQIAENCSFFPSTSVRRSGSSTRPEGW